MSQERYFIQEVFVPSPRRRGVRMVFADGVFLSSAAEASASPVVGGPVGQAPAGWWPDEDKDAPPTSNDCNVPPPLSKGCQPAPASMFCNSFFCHGDGELPPSTFCESWIRCLSITVCEAPRSLNDDCKAPEEPDDCRAPMTSEEDPNKDCPLVMTSACKGPDGSSIPTSEDCRAITTSGLWTEDSLTQLLRAQLGDDGF